MLIQFTGAGGTGKTTTRELFQATEFGQGFVTVRSSARVVSERWGIATEDDQDRLSVVEFLRFQRDLVRDFLGSVHSAIDAGQDIVTERSMIDPVAYSHLRLAKMDAGMSAAERKESLELLDRLEALALEELPLAKIVAFFPAGLFEPPSDGFRTSREIERKTVDLVMRGLVWKYQRLVDLPVAEMRVLDPQTRAQHLAGLGKRLAEELVETGPSGG